MKRYVLTAAICFIPGIAFAQVINAGIPGTGLPGTIGPSGSVIPYPVIFGNYMQQQRMRMIDANRFLHQLAEMRSHSAAGNVARGMLTTAESRELEIEARN